MPKLTKELFGVNARGNRVKNVGKPFEPTDSQTFAVPSLTTTERDALPNITNGTIIYNTSLNKLQARENGAWVNII